MTDDIDTDNIITSVWRSGNNCGCKFSRKDEPVVWQDMTSEERRECIENLMCMAEFFAGLLSCERKVED